MFATTLAVPALLAVGCSGDDIAEKISEQGLGDGSDVSIDSESGDLSIKTEDGELDASTGTGTELPEGWPSDIPLPDDYTLTSAVKMGNPPEMSWTVSAEVPDAVAAFEDVTARFVSGGWTELQKSTSDQSEAVTLMSVYKNGEVDVTFAATAIDGESIHTVSYTAIQSTS